MGLLQSKPLFSLLKQMVAIACFALQATICQPLSPHVLPGQDKLCHLRKLPCVYKSSATSPLEPSWQVTSLALHFLGLLRSEGASTSWDERTKAGGQGS